MATGGTASGRAAARRRRRTARGSRRPPPRSCCAAGPAPVRRPRTPCARRRPSLGYRPDRTASLLARRRTPPARRAARRQQPVPRRAGAGARQRLGRPRRSTSCSAPRRRAPTSTRPPRPCSTSAARHWCCSARRCRDADLDRPRGARARRSPSGAPVSPGVTGVLAADDRGARGSRSTTSSLSGTAASRSSTGRAGSIARARRRATATRWPGTGSAPASTWCAGAPPRPTARRRPPGCCRGRPGAPDRRHRLQRPGGHRAARRPAALGGWAVPGDVSVVGYDDSPMARLGTIDLTVGEPGARRARRRHGRGGRCPARRGAPGSRCPTWSSHRGSSSAPPPGHRRVEVENTPRGPQSARRVLYPRRLRVSGRPRRCAPGGAPWPTGWRPRRSTPCPWRPRWCTARPPRRRPPRRTSRARGGTPRSGGP